MIIPNSWRKILRFLLILAILSTAWFSIATLILVKQKVPFTTIIHSILLGVSTIPIRAVLKANIFILCIVVISVSPLFLLARPAHFLMDAVRIFKDFPHPWLIATLSMFWLPAIASIAIVYRTPRDT